MTCNSWNVSAITDRELAEALEQRWKPPQASPAETIPAAWQALGAPLETAAPMPAVMEVEAVAAPPAPAVPYLAPVPTPRRRPVERDETSIDPVPLSDVEEEEVHRDPTEIKQLDAVLGGGLAVGAVVILSGEPGSGKTSLTIQAMDGLKLRVLYAVGEESVRQAAHRARRLDCATPRVFIVAETDLDTILTHARTLKVDVVVIDSIQTLTCSSVNGRAGSPSQVKECTVRLAAFAHDDRTKPNETAVWLIGHVTGEGDLAGPKTLKHLVDVVLEIENATPTRRILRCGGKNRFGASDVIGKFEMTARGLIEADEDSEADRVRCHTCGHSPLDDQREFHTEGTKES